ncbi:MAG TPA: hypothetical protein VGJ87_00135, partial [Roseiflexaceae bacterium]
RRAQAGLAYRRALVQAEQGDWAGVIATLAAVPDEAADDDLRALLITPAQNRRRLRKLPSSARKPSVSARLLSIVSDGKPPSASGSSEVLGLPRLTVSRFP